MPDRSQRWLCTVCGYIHDGAEPCDCCPVCGATSDLFEFCHETQSTPTPATVSVGSWRCLNCEYVHQGDQPPELCPICAATAEHFEPFVQAPETPAASRQELSVVIAGAGIAGVSAAEAVRKSSPRARITLLSREAELPYYRLNLTRYLAGELGGDDLPIHSQSWYNEQNITLLRETELRSIDARQQTLGLRGAESLTYDRLILALGSHPFVPPFPGVNRENVTVLRTRRDADFILQTIYPDMPCVIIGGGLLGLEAAGALTRRQAKVTLVEGYDWLMPQQLNQAAAERLVKHATGLGISFRMGARVKQLDGDEQVRGVTLESGETLAAELVIITAGIRSNSYIARLAQIETNSGIVVNNRLQTDNTNIYAVGDVAEHRGVLYGTWGPSQFQGTIAGMNVAGEQVEFAGIPRANSLKVLGYELFSIGRTQPLDGSYLAIEESAGKHYFYFLFRDSRLMGAILLGDTRLSATVKQLIENKVQCHDLLAQNASGGKINQLLTNPPPA